MGETNEECEERVEERSNTQAHDAWMVWRALTPWANVVWDIIKHADKHEKMWRVRVFCSQKHTCLSTTDSPVWAPSPIYLLLQQGLLASAPSVFEWDMTQKLCAHRKRHIWCTPSPSTSKRTPFLFYIHSSSTLAKIWFAIFCHKRGASTLPCRTHLLKLKRLSTLSKEVIPDSPDKSRRRAEISHPCFLWLSKILATWFGLPHRRLSWCPSLPCTSSVSPLFHISTLDSFLLAIPSVSVVDSWPILEDVGSLSRPLHPYAGSSSFQVLFSFSRRNRIQLAYHWDITDVKAVAR